MTRNNSRRWCDLSDAELGHVMQTAYSLGVVDAKKRKSPRGGRQICGFISKHHGLTDTRIWHHKKVRAVYGAAFDLTQFHAGIRGKSCK